VGGGRARVLLLAGDQALGQCGVKSSDGTAYVASYTTVPVLQSSTALVSSVQLQGRFRVGVEMEGWP
jgi:hypothetical protein